ncbi:MAG TPA: hypothetical protein VN372_03950 [Methanospirillum sp.]|nr:hypothetical protein [Methanospirillum sp.]
MPITPYHLGPVLLLSISGMRISVPMFAIGSVAPDIGALYCLFAGCPLHGWHHTIAAGIILSLIITGIPAFLLYLIFQTGFQIRITAGLHDCMPVFLSLASGWILHVLLDAVFYPEINLFYPIPRNPLYNLVSPLLIMAGCVGAGVAGLAVHSLRLITDGKDRAG